MATTRNQPSYDFLTGEPSSPQRAQQQQMRASLRQSSAPGIAARPAPANEDSRAHIKTLEYELNSLKQDRDLVALQHATDLRDAQSRAEADHKRAQSAEQHAKSAATKYEQLTRELAERQTEWANERAELEKKARTVTSQREVLREELEEAQEAVGALERETVRKAEDAEGRLRTLKTSYEQLQEEVVTKSGVLQNTQSKLAAKERECGALEADVLRLRAGAGASEEVEILKKDLAEQVVHIRKLEAENRDMKARLTDLAKNKKSIEMVQEEKRSLETKLRLQETLGVELEEVRLRNEALENERTAWTSYLERQGAADEEMRFDSPEDLARAFMRERLEKASLLERLGAIQPEVAIKDENIRTLEDERSQLSAEIEKLKQQPSSSTTDDSKAKARLERQKNLAVKETEYLRAQLKAIDAEEGEVNPESYSAAQTARIAELESLIDQYRTELSTLNTSISSLQSPHSIPQPAVNIGTKRSLEESSASDERIGELIRKQRALQDTITESQTRITVLESELKAKSSQLSSLRSSSRVRVLELKDNPTSTAASIKVATLTALQSENAALRAQVSGKLPTSLGSGKPDSSLVPKGSLDRLQLEMSDKEASIASKEKSLNRLKEIFRAKGLEFKEAVYSLLGWQLSFLPNGKVRATSMFYPSPSSGRRTRSRGKKGDDEEEAEEKQFIEFDGENGTMKVSGGPQSEFAKEIRGLIEFWVDGKGQVPCFLAAMTLEFYDKYGDSIAAGGK